MDTELVEGIDPEIDTHSILLAASQHDAAVLRKLLRGPTSNPANVKDPDTGYSPLHSAIASCEPATSENVPDEQANGATASVPVVNGEKHSDAATEQGSEEQEAVETVRLLLQNGAIWNDLNSNGETPGCLARRFGLKILYEIMVDAGVRAEILLNRLDEYERLEDGDDEDNDEEESKETEATMIEGEDNPATTATAATGELQTEESATAIQPAQGLALDVNSEDYLHSALTFTNDKIVDEDQNGVMMSWETQIMQKTADAIAPKQGLKILNIGHGMGIIDKIFQSKAPSAHHIIEAHPEVLRSMKENGWYGKEEVTVHEGKWQDIVPKLIEDGKLFDAIYFDTFAEDYSALRKFFDEYMIGILEDDGKWSFFNGLGADRQICYDVYIKVAEMDLLDAGFDVDWTALPVPNLQESGTWNDLHRPYWSLDTYRLPVITFMA
ncbi:MAG: Arginine N-methyltransferase 2 [Stictis urceolatum]|nr:Arginine N-methyltransferase 2 [Stictis urceolata]